MLGEKSYDRAYVAQSRAAFGRLMESYGRAGTTPEFEQAFLAHAVLALDHYFLHRLRGVEGKDGNALNEVRMLCASIKAGGGLMADSTIRYDAGRSVLGLGIGEAVVLTPEGVTRLAAAFFDQIEERFT